MTNPNPGSSQGPAIDRTGTPVVDPTENVKADIRSADRRQDDLRELSTRRLEDLRIMEAAHQREITEVRVQAQKDLAAAESKRIDATALAESRRIDALLGAAANAVTLASTRAELTATALAERVDTSAKTLAQSVVASAQALQAQATASTEAQNSMIALMRTTFDGRIVPLEQVRYRGEGQATRDDPLMAEVVAELKAQRALLQGQSGERRGGQQVWGYIAAAFGLVLAAAALFMRKP